MAETISATTRYRIQEFVIIKSFLVPNSVEVRRLRHMYTSLMPTTNASQLQMNYITKCIPGAIIVRCEAIEVVFTL